VEHHEAPETLEGVVRDVTGTVTQTRPICMYPFVAAYKGNGDPNAASSFVCRPSPAH
jgi:hypothetical protein